MNKVVTMGHGAGGRESSELIKELFVKHFSMKEPLTDSAVVKSGGIVMAFTTDSYVIDPLFFPGGNIGKLAICGTINDLSVSGAVPEYISASFIIEEGFPVSDLETIVSSMAEEARNANVRIVTGDTKVVERGKCDKLFITTAGTGYVRPGCEEISSGVNIKSGDILIVNGSLGNHAIAVLGARNSLNFSTGIISDCASLNSLIMMVIDKGIRVNFMRDLTRGGIAAVLSEIAKLSGKGIHIDEASIPVDEPVRGLCEVLGYDPCNLANEGKVLFVVSKDEAENLLPVLKAHSLGRDASVIGSVTERNAGLVVVNTITGGRRILELPSGILLPRIC